MFFDTLYELDIDGYVAGRMFTPLHSAALYVSAIMATCFLYEI